MYTLLSGSGIIMKGFVLSCELENWAVVCKDTFATTTMHFYLGAARVPHSV